MANIATEIKNFLTAIYGKDVRASLVSLAEKLNHEVENNTVAANNAAYSANEAAVNANAATERANTAAEGAEEAIGNANTAASNANVAAEQAKNVSVVKLEDEVTELKSDFTEHKEHGVNNNILINSNFANPVNQRGVTAETWAKYSYGLDRWYMHSVDINSLSPLVIKAHDKTIYYHIEQRIEKSEIPTNSILTMSCKVNGNVISHTFQYGFSEVYSADGKFRFVFNVYDTCCTFCLVPMSDSEYVTIEWAKLEIGNHATPYVPRLYAEELTLCKRYYEIIDSKYVQAVFYSNKNVFAMLEYVEKRIIPTITALDDLVVWQNPGQGSVEYSSTSVTTNECDCKSAMVLVSTSDALDMTKAVMVRVYKGIAIDAEL